MTPRTLRFLAASLLPLLAGGAALWADERAAGARKPSPTQEHVEDATVGEEFGFVFAIDLGAAPETTWIEVTPGTTVPDSGTAAGPAEQTELAEEVTGGEVEVLVEPEAEPVDEVAVEEEGAAPEEVSDEAAAGADDLAAAEDAPAAEGEDGAADFEKSEVALEAEGADEAPVEEVATTADDTAEPDAPPTASAAGADADSR